MTAGPVAPSLAESPASAAADAGAAGEPAKENDEFDIAPHEGREAITRKSQSRRINPYG